MRIKDINGIVDSLINLRNWRHPLANVDHPNKVKINLLTGQITSEGEDSVTELLTEKHEWFINRIKDLDGNLEDFEKAEIKIFLKKESVKIIYKGKKFSKERIF